MNLNLCFMPVMCLSPRLLPVPLPEELHRKHKTYYSSSRNASACGGVGRKSWAYSYGKTERAVRGPLAGNVVNLKVGASEENGMIFQKSR